MIGSFQHGARLDLTGVGSQAHSPTLRQVPLLVRHQIDHRVGAFGIKLTGIRVAPGENVSGVFDHRHLHSQTDAEIRDAVDPGVMSRVSHSLNASAAKASGHDDAVHSL